LLQCRASWNMLCSCLDVIEDTQEAIASYHLASPDDVGLKYLQLYGILQALFVQQDAVQNLAKALELPYSRNALLRRIRDVRNDSVGHPTDRGGHAYNFVVRAALSTEGFDLITVYDDGRPPGFSQIDIRELLETQQTSVIETLEAFIHELQEEERRHREEFRDVKLADAFPATLDYYFQKVFEATRRPEHHEFGAMHVDLIRRCIAKLKDALAERGIVDAYEPLTDAIKDVEWPLQELHRFFRHDPDSTLSGRSAYIFTYYCRDQVNELREMAKEVDKRYENAP